MRVLVGCESSGVVREAFRERGHDAWSCDLLPADDGSEYHLHGDVLAFLPHGWDLAIFHPPCTRLCNSGVRWLAERDLWGEMQAGADLFAACLHAPIPRVAVENPVMHGHAKRAIRGYVPPAQSIQPWQFGHPDKKRTCLWLRGLPPLTPTEVVPECDRVASIHLASPGPDRWKIRSKTFAGVAAAMADQWGEPAQGSLPLQEIMI